MARHSNLVKVAMELIDDCSDLLGQVSGVHCACDPGSMVVLILQWCCSKVRAESNGGLPEGPWCRKDVCTSSRVSCKSLFHIIIEEEAESIRGLTCDRYKH